MKIHLSTIIDTAFTLFITFILSYILFYYFIPRSFAIIFSAVISSLLSLLTFKILSTKKLKTKLSKAEKQEKEIMATQFCLYTKEEQLNFFIKALKKAGFNFEKKYNYIYNKEKNVAIFSLFSFDGVNKTNIVKVFNSILKNDTAYILSKDFTSEIEEFANRFDGRIKLISAQEIYVFLSKNEILPKQKYPLNSNKKFKLKDFRILLSKKKSKTHLAFGLAFIFFSYFVPIKLYYLICGAIFLILALISRLFGIEKEKAIA